MRLNYLHFLSADGSGFVLRLYVGYLLQFSVNADHIRMHWHVDDLRMWQSVVECGYPVKRRKEKGKKHYEIREIVSQHAIASR